MKVPETLTAQHLVLEALEAVDEEDDEDRSFLEAQLAFSLDVQHPPEEGWERFLPSVEAICTRVMNNMKIMLASERLSKYNEM
jgi:hypothetical protein